MGIKDPDTNKFRNKSKEELKRQIEETSGKLGEKLIPPSAENLGESADLISMDIDEIRNKYGARYKAYLEMLRRPDSAKADMYRKIIGALDKLDSYISGHKAQRVRPTLYDRQFTVFEDIRDFLESGETEGYIKLPTGSGKTVIFTEFIEATGLRTLIVVPTRILVGQTEEKITEFAEGVDVGKIYTDSKEHGHSVTITTYNSFVQRVEAGDLKPEDFDLLVLDEAHKSLSEKRSETVRKFNGAIKIGFTATPRYSDDRQVANLLNTEIHNMEIREAVNEGMMCPFSVIIAETDTDISNVKVTGGGEYSENELARVINNESRNRAAMELYQKEFKGQPAIAYCCGIDHAENLALFLNGGGIPAGVISGRMTVGQQNDVRKGFADGEIKVLCNADILIEGFDQPHASVCLNLRPTLSPVMAEQRAGRVLRADETNPLKFATIVDFIDANRNRKNAPVSFAQIVNGALIEGPDRSSGLRAKGNIEQPWEISIRGLKVTTIPREVMRIVRKIEKDKYRTAPPGWKPRHVLAKEHQKNYTLVSRIAVRLGQGHPEWFDLLLDEDGNLYEHLSPELVEQVTERLTAFEKAPEGWMTFTGLADALGRGFKTVKIFAEDYREKRPLWFKLYLGGKNQLVEHYSPELCYAILNDLLKYDDAPEGWTTANGLVKITRKTSMTIRKYAKKYRSEHPEWFKVYLNVKCRPFEHYSPELAEKLTAELTAYEYAPEGWMTASALSASVGGYEQLVYKKAAAAREEHPDWFHEYLAKSGIAHEHMAPELVRRIVDDIGAFPPPPDGWLNGTASARELETGHRNLLVIVADYRNRHPEWFGMYKPKKGPIIEYYSPELLKEAKKSLGERPSPPAGWMSASMLTRKFESSHKKITQTAEIFRKKHPEWFGKYFSDKGREHEYYHPDLIKNISESLSEERKLRGEKAGSKANTPVVPQAPSGWKSVAALRRELKKADETISNVAAGYRETNPEWFEIYKAGSTITEHFSPELVKIITEEVSKNRKAPEGWLTASAFATESGSSHTTVTKTAEKHRKQHPEWFAEYLDSRDHLHEHYSPDLIAELTKGFELEETAPEGWMTAEALARSISVPPHDVAPQTVQRRAVKYLSKHPEWAKEYLNVRKRLLIHYHPDLVKEMIAELTQYAPVPPGWMSNNQLSARFKVGFYDMKKITDGYRGGHPDWFAFYKPEKGNPAEYCSPELVAELEKRMPGA